MLFLLAFALTVFAASDVSRYERLLVITMDRGTISNSLFTVLDINHQRMLATGFYTQAQVDALRANSITYLKDRFGLDFSLGTPYPDWGSISLPQATLYPYSSNYNHDAYLVYDSLNKQRGKDGDWYGMHFGEIVLMTGAGNFTSGSAAGQSYGVGDILGYFEYSFVQFDLTTNTTKQRETMILRLHVPTKQVPNSQGVTEQYVKGELVDNLGNLGYYNDIVSVETNNGVSLTRLRKTLTFGLLGGVTP